MNKKELKEIRNIIESNKNIEISIYITTYDKGGYIRYADWKARVYLYSESDKRKLDVKDILYFEGTEKAGGGGYCKESTVISNSINNIIAGFKYNIEDKSKHYGLNYYENKTYISYGIGTDAVLKCAEYLGFNIESKYYGRNENNFNLKYISK